MIFEIIIILIITYPIGLLVNLYIDNKKWSEYWAKVDAEKKINERDKRGEKT